MSRFPSWVTTSNGEASHECVSRILCLLSNICHSVAHPPGCLGPLWNSSQSVKYLVKVTTCTIKNGYHLVALILLSSGRLWAGWGYSTEFGKESEGERGHLCVTGPNFHLLIMFFLIKQRSLGNGASSLEWDCRSSCICSLLLCLSPPYLQLDHGIWKQLWAFGFFFSLAEGTLKWDLLFVPKWP